MCEKFPIKREHETGLFACTTFTLVQHYSFFPFEQLLDGAYRGKFRELRIVETSKYDTPIGSFPPVASIIKIGKSIS